MSTPGTLAQIGDVVRVTYRLGDVVANDMLVTGLSGSDLLQGIVGAVVRANGQVDAWWLNGPRMAAGASLRPPATVTRKSVEYVWRNGKAIATSALSPAPAPPPEPSCAALYAAWQRTTATGQPPAIIAALKNKHAACCAKFYAAWQRAIAGGMPPSIIAALRNKYEQGCREAISASSARPARTIL